MQTHKLIRQELNGFTNCTFDHISTPIIGVGADHKPFIDMEPYLDTSLFDDLHDEICLGLAKIQNYTLPEVIGTQPPVLNIDKIHTDQFEAEVYRHLDRHPDSQKHLQHLGKLDNEQERRKYCIFALGAQPPWWFSLVLLHARFREKTVPNKNWSAHIEIFPQLRAYLESLPIFTSIGRVLLFATYPHAGVPPHRDFLVESHSDHCVNFFFTAPRPSYLFDSVQNQKIHLQPTRAYFFNNRDYHGVDPEPVFRYTLRVDGEFTDEICKNLNLYGKKVCVINTDNDT